MSSVLKPWFFDITVTSLITSVLDSLQQLCYNLLALFSLAKWKRYRPLWKLDKTIVMEKFANKNPSCVAYDDKLQFYTRIMEEVGQQPMTKVSKCTKTCELCLFP